VKGASGDQFPEIQQERIEVEPKRPLDAELEDFIATVHRRGTPLVTGKAALEALRVAHQVREKIESDLAKENL
jgi:predicted dehydrogenase